MNKLSMYPQQHTTVLPKDRIDWIDYVRGVSIFFVVLLHFILSTQGSGAFDLSAIGQQLDNYNHYFPNVAPFFLLAGLFVAKSVQKPLSHFLSDKLRTLLYPYLIWSLLTIIGIALSGGSRDPWENLSRIPHFPFLQFWYLYTLFWMMALYAGLHHLKLKPIWFLTLSAAGFIAGTVIGLEWLGIPKMGPIYDLTCWTIVFAIGAVYGQRIRAWVEQASTKVIAIGFLLPFILWFSVVLFGDATPLPWLQMLVRCCGMIAFVCLSILISRWGQLPVIKYWGQLSLQIYVAHWLILVGVRFVLVRFLKIDLFPLFMVCSLAAGIYVPIFVNWLANKIGFKYAFSMPQPIPTAAETASTPGEQKVPAPTLNPV